ncbi:hypothetical protein CCACVL1_08841 [Corchorus capsularis]|uniref:Uncharacterized protein n=1 Tax=Corchorus capsularis TaxID=210143 RepID=A0A1R3IYJ7_COCAP|nr:hypothetical protein CCACVL1_08841 [Corchorus capsularis]
MALSTAEKKIVIKGEDDDDNNNFAEDQEEQENMENNYVSSHLYIKPSHSKQALDKEVVLRRIRHRKRMNNVKSTLQSFLGSSWPPKRADHNNKVSSSVHDIKWVDDAFAAL